MKYFYAFFIITTLLLSNQKAFSQLASAPARGSIKGRIRTNDGKPAPHVNIYIVENNKKTLSDEDGYFTFINLKDGTYT